MKTTEKNGRDVISSEETERRRQLYKLYNPMHHRIRQYINEIKSQQHKNYTVQQISQLLTRLEFDELDERRGFGSDMLRTLRAMYRCAQREKVTVIQDLEQMAEHERIRLEIHEKQQAIHRQQQSEKLFKSIQLKMQHLEYVEEKKRDDLCNEEFRFWIQLSLQHSDGKDKSTTEANKRLDIERTQQRNDIQNVQQGRGREEIESQERQERAAQRFLYIDNLQIVRGKLLAQKLGDWEVREANGRRGKETTLGVELATLHMAVTEKHETYMRRRALLDAEKSELYAIMDGSNLLFTDAGCIKFSSGLASDAAAATDDDSFHIDEGDDDVAEEEDDLCPREKQELNSQRSKIVEEIVAEIISGALKSHHHHHGDEEK